MQPQHIPMSVVEYEALPKPFGYKVEYWGGKTVITPYECPVDCQLTISAHRAVNPVCAVPVDLSQQEALIQGFFTAFHDTVEFCGWSEDAVWAHTKMSIAGYFAGQRGNPHSLSRVILDAANQIQACALLVENNAARPELDLLFIHPNQQRQGIARCLVEGIINQLYQQGHSQLFSTYHICNQASRAWHESMGFEPIPQGCYARLSYAWHRDELHRLQKLNPDIEYPELQQKLAYWQQRMAEMERA